MYYEKLERIPGENLYVEFDPEFGVWAIFGDESGFCYRQVDSEETAESHLESLACPE